MIASQISRATRSEDSSPPNSPQVSRRVRPNNLDKKNTTKQVAAITNRYYYICFIECIFNF